jgi:hypothetical protein
MIRLSKEVITVRLLEVQERRHALRALVKSRLQLSAALCNDLL